MNKHQRLLEGQVRHIREICQSCLGRDVGYSDRAWLAQSVLNILNGNIDAQILDEQHRISR